MRTLSLILPVFNEFEALPHTCNRLRQVAAVLLAQGISHVEFVFVDDGSIDGSDQVLAKEKMQFAAIPSCSCEVLHFSRNFGHSAAVFAGLACVKGDLVGIIDADLQDPPELIPKMIQSLDQNQADVVYGQRVERKGESAFKKFTAWLFYRVLNALSGVDIPRDTGDFRLMTREVSDVVSSLTEREPFLRGLVAWVGFKQVAYPYERQAREHGTTKYPLSKMIKFASHAIISFSLLPLRLAIYAGILGMLCGLGFAAYAVYMRAAGYTVPGWTSLVVGFTFGQSTTLLIIGIIGVYLGRVHSSLQQRPRYILRKTRA